MDIAAKKNPSLFIICTLSFSSFVECPVIEAPCVYLVPWMGRAIRPCTPSPEVLCVPLQV